MSTDWGTLPLPWLTEAMEASGYSQMTPVQASTVPLLSGNKDVVVQAVTGSGKTLAFVLPALIRLEKLPKLTSGQTNVIVLAPTRELATQIHTVFKDVLRYLPEDKIINTQLVTGGNTVSPIADLRTFLTTRPHILVATSGRLLELLRSKNVKTDAVDLLILDEADKLLNSGDDSVHTILQLLPKQKRIGLFSATLNNLVNDLVRARMRNPVKVSVESPTSLPETLSVSYYTIEEHEKPAAALTILKNTPYFKAIVYAPTCISVDLWYQIFKMFLDCKIFSLHGKLKQNVRAKTLENYINSVDRCILLTTDVAARGLDIDDVDFVLQLDPPSDANMFVHRSGRTARAQRSGLSSILLFKGLEERFVDLMAVRKVPMTESTLDDMAFEPSTVTDKLREWTRKDRANHDVAIRALLSFVRFYSKHTATSIFRLETVNVPAFAKSLGILRLPRMPESRGRSDIPEDGWLVEAFDWDSFAYNDKEQERSRLEKLEAPKEKKVVNKERNTVAWSAQTERKEEASKRREKRNKRAIAKKSNEDSSDSETQQDWKELVQAKRHKNAEQVMHFDL